MDLLSVACQLNAQTLTPRLDLSRQVFWAYGADLLSDVLAFTRPQTLLLTGLISNQVIRTAELADLGGIVVVRNKSVSPAIIEMAARCNIPMLKTSMTMFESCGRLYMAGLMPCSSAGGEFNVRSAL